MILRKINSFIIVISLVLGYFTFVSAVSKASAETETDGLAYALHIAEKKDAEKLLTRGNAAGMVIRLLGYDEEMLESGQIFDDVSESDKNAAAIYHAAELGIIASGSLYEPDKTITYEQFYKMVVAALGYTEQAEYYGGYPYGYARIASDLKLNRNVYYNDSNLLTVNTAAKIVENALDAVKLPQTGIIEKGQDKLLYKAFRLEKYRGLVTAAYMSSFTPNSYAQGEDDVYINDTHYKKGESGIENMLGYYVDFYVRDDSEEIKTVVFAKKRDYNELQISPEDISKVKVNRNGIELSYYKSEKSNREVTEKLLFASASLIYNGFYTDITRNGDDLFDFKDGGIKLVDNDNDKVWDFVIIEHLTTAVVKTYSSTTKTLAFEYEIELGAVDAGILDFTKYDTVLFEGKTNYSNIMPGNVLEICLPKNDVFPDKVIRLDLSDRIMRSELEQKISDDGTIYMYMDGDCYELSDDYAAYAKDAFEGVHPGVEYTVYLTKSGKIAYIINHLDDERVYGYLTYMSLSRKDDITMRVYMDDGKFHLFEFTEKVRIFRDGEDKGYNKRINVTDGLFAGGEFDRSNAQLIRFRPNRDSKVDLIEFAENPLGAEAAAEGNMYGKFIKSRSKFTGTYYHMSQVMYTAKGPEFPLPPNTICYSVPSDPSEFGDERNFSVGGYGGQRAEITVDTYNDSEIGSPGIIVKYGSVDKYQDFAVNTSIAVVQKVENAAGFDGEICDKMTDSMGNTYFAKKEDNVFSDKITGEKLKRGDVVQIGTTKAGYVQFVEMIFFMDSSSPNGYGYTYTDPSSHIRNSSDMVISCGVFDSERICASGYLTAITPQYIKIRNEAGEEAVFKCYDKEHYLYTVYTDSKVIINEKLDQINIGDYIVVRCTFSNLQEVVRYVR